jgi:hypothetical protein
MLTGISSFVIILSVATTMMFYQHDLLGGFVCAAILCCYLAATLANDINDHRKGVK